MVYRPDNYNVLLHQKLELSIILFRNMKHGGHLEKSGHIEKMVVPSLKLLSVALTTSMPDLKLLTQKPQFLYQFTTRLQTGCMMHGSHLENGGHFTNKGSMMDLGAHLGILG